MAKASVFTILASASLLCLALAFSVSVFAAVQSAAYVDSRNLFSINPPSGWTIDSSGALRTAVIFYGPTDSSFRINMNVVAQATSLSLSDYAAATKTQLSISLYNYRLVSETSKTIGGIATDELVNNFTSGAFSIKNQEDILVQNGRAYVITSTALQTNFNTYQPSFAESVQTFQVTTAPPAPAFPWLIVTISIVILVGVIVGVIFLFWRRKNRATALPPMPPPMNQPPPPSSPPAQA